ncbi:MAG: ABC transporter permease [Bacteroidetes bacterium]|nr:MAG: ABC transporter permease [Bacteroidota bacterium]
MLKNYLKVAIRSLRKQKVYSFVNVFGLAVGMASCILIFMLVWHEWSYDRFHENADNIYRTYLEYKSPDGAVSVQAMMTPGFTESITGTFPSIEKATQFVTSGQDLQVGESFFRRRLAEVSTDFFQMFSFPLVLGDVESSLDAPESMIITKESAGIMFGLEPGNETAAMGKVVSVTRNEITYDFTVVGIVDDFPNNSSIAFDVAISFENYSNIRLGGNNFGGRVSTYIQLPVETSGQDMEAMARTWVDTEFQSYITALRSNGALANGDNAYALRFQPLAAMHLNPDVWVPYEVQPHNPMYSLILSGIGLLILLIACINFMTLSVGQSTGRAREVGMRKVLGAYKGQLMKQYWGESFVITAISLVVGVVLAVLILPLFNVLTGNALSFSSISPVLAIGAVVGLILVVGFVAGGYPALVLSSFQPTAVLKGASGSANSNWLTRVLVVVQYTISVALIIGTGVMTQQLHYMLDKDLGYNQDLIVAVNAYQVGRTDADNVVEHFESSLIPQDGIVNLSKAGSSFTRGSDRNTWTDGDGITRSAYNFGVGYNYLDVMGMELVEGRNFSKDFPTDPTDAVLVNEALVRELGIQDPIGHVMSGWLSFLIDDPVTIIGVVKDFHFQSLREEVQPAVMNMLPNYYNYLGAFLIKIKGNDVAGNLALIENTWNEAQPSKPFTYSFLDADIANQYQTEQRWSNIVTYSSILAIIIACMGLFGLAILTVTKRLKEIGIRKVLGASIPNVAGLVAKEFAILVLVASIIAVPLAYFAMHSWLEDFAFKITMSPLVFISAAGIAFAIAMGTVSFQSIRAARLNPVDTLRHE